MVYSPVAYSSKALVTSLGTGFTLRFGLMRRQMYVRYLVLTLLLVSACGSVPNQGSPPLPTPPTAALAKWNDFPANAHPRPIILFGDAVEHIQPSGFSADPPRKLAWTCNKLALGADVLLSTVPLSATTISAATAWSQLMNERSANENKAPECAPMAPFMVTAARLTEAGFPTDRGTTQMAAWLFDVPEIGGYVGYVALEASSFWGGAVSAQGRGARVSGDGLTLKVPVGNPGTGPCDTQYTASVAESGVAVAVAVKGTPNAPADQPVACPAILRVGYISVALRAPLGGRVLLDEKGQVGMVCPETGDC